MTASTLSFPFFTSGYPDSELIITVPDTVVTFGYLNWSYIGIVPGTQGCPATSIWQALGNVWMRSDWLGSTPEHQLCLHSLPA